MSDGIVQIPGFAVVQKDRKVIDQGGVCAYIQEGNCRYKQRKDLNCCLFCLVLFISSIYLFYKPLILYYKIEKLKMLFVELNIRFQE